MNNVMHLWGMQVANLKTGEIITASLPDHPPGDPGLLHGIGWTPDQKEVWESSIGKIRMSMSGQWIIQWSQFSNKL